MNKEVIAILGGTGDLGSGLAIRWARAHYPICIGSRTQAKADDAKAALEEIDPGIAVRAMENAAAAEAADIVTLTVPFAHQLSTLESVRAQLHGKILIDTTVPLIPPRVGTVQLPEEGSAAARAQRFLGDGVLVVSAFQNVAAHLLRQWARPIACDVLICGNDKVARRKVLDLVKAIGLRGWQAGPIANSAAAEALTSVLIQINRQGELSHSGIQIIGQAAH